MATVMTKTDLVHEIVDRMDDEMTSGQVRGVLDALSEIAGEEVSKHGAFSIPGVVKLNVKRTKARKSRRGTNPFTGEPMTFKAKPAGKVVRARVLKTIKDAV